MTGFRAYGSPLFTVNATGRTGSQIEQRHAASLREAEEIAVGLRDNDHSFVAILPVGRERPLSLWRRNEYGLWNLICGGPSSEPGEPCGRLEKARGLCSSHLSQEARGRPLAPLRDRPGDLVPCPIRIPRPVAESASADPRGARAALVSWHSSRS